MYTHDPISGITTFSQEVLDLRELFVLLTYQCNGNCPFCIEHNIGEKGFLSDENFDRAIDFSIEKGLTSIFYMVVNPQYILMSSILQKKQKKMVF